MKALFYTALTIAMIFGLMGIFFGYIIYISGKDLREINQEALFISGCIVSSSVGAIIFGTPLTQPLFWSTLKEHKEAIIRLHEEEEKLMRIRHKYEQKLASKDVNP